MYDYKARTYSPTLGRFLQTDPAGYPDGPNWYAMWAMIR
jgi:RHS repeat-associated protein